MKFTIVFLALLAFLLPAQAKKPLKSRNASGYKNHKAPKVKAHKAGRSKHNRAN